MKTTKKFQSALNVWMQRWTSHAPSTHTCLWLQRFMYISIDASIVDVLLLIIHTYSYKHHPAYFTPVYSQSTCWTVLRQNSKSKHTYIQVQCDRGNAAMWTDSSGADYRLLDSVEFLTRLCSGVYWICCLRFDLFFCSF